jgi:hypothetical protein
MSELYRDSLLMIHRLAAIEAELTAIINQLAVEKGIDPVPLMSKLNEMSALRTSYVKALETLVTSMRLKIEKR